MAKIRTRVTPKGVISELVADDVGTSFTVAVAEEQALRTTTTVTTASAGDGLHVVGAPSLLVLPTIDANTVGKTLTVVATGSAQYTLSASQPLITPSGAWTAAVQGDGAITTVIALPTATGFFWAVRTLG